MKILVTGAGGFIGSHLCDHLLRKGHDVTGIEGFVGSTPGRLKTRNLKKAESHPNFHLEHTNLLEADWNQLLKNKDAVFHLAGIPGVRSSWGDDFKQYIDHNIWATQKLLEVCRNRPLKKFVYISTSSVYGETSGKTSETTQPAPLSPYGVSKLTGEYLCRVYQIAFGVPVVILRYFTVYGPRQRPDMAFHRFIRMILQGESIPIYGDGQQTRDFTYVEDCVAGTAAVLNADDVIGETINIGGKERASVLDVMTLLEKITGKKAQLDFQENPRGEPKHTRADIAKAEQLLGYKPKISLQDGLKKEVQDLSELYGREKL
ncbi:MAG TPA: NAD-dependent epimerase/dehydratase family protein [Bacillales bacterium]|nr:NAD-dependent epimerase/dehydratase family protein [Bacillales bacterium]